MEKKLIDYTKEELIEFIKKSREIYSLEESDSIEQILTDRVRRTLDLRDIMKATRANHKRSRRIINKYIKPMKKEADVKKLLKKQDEEVIIIESRYVASMVDLMMIVIKALSSEMFQRKLASLEQWYEFESDDLILVNGIIKALQHDNSFSVSNEEVMNALDDAIYEYVYCIEKDLDYRKRFDSKFMFVCFPEKKEENTNEEEQEDNDE